MGTICDFRTTSTKEEVKIIRIDNDTSTSPQENKSDSIKETKTQMKDDVLFTINDHNSILKEDKEMRLEEVESNSSIQFDKIKSVTVNTYMKKKSLINSNTITHGLRKKINE